MAPRACLCVFPQPLGMDRVRHEISGLARDVICHQLAEPRRNADVRQAVDVLWTQPTRTANGGTANRRLARFDFGCDPRREAAATKLVRGTTITRTVLEALGYPQLP